MFLIAQPQGEYQDTSTASLRNRHANDWLVGKIDNRCGNSPCECFVIPSVHRLLKSQELPPTCRELFASGYNEDIALRHLGPDDAFLQKPFTPRVLAQKCAARA